MDNNTDMFFSLRNLAVGSEAVSEAIDDIEKIVGDVPVSVQLNDALSEMSRKDHVHDEYVTLKEFNQLKQIVENLVNLVGDESVAVQINNAMNREV